MRLSGIAEPGAVFLLRAETEFRPDLPTKIKERAWSSPNWTSSN